MHSLHMRLERATGWAFGTVRIERAAQRGVLGRRLFVGPLGDHVDPTLPRGWSAWYNAWREATGLELTVCGRCLYIFFATGR